MKVKVHLINLSIYTFHKRKKFQISLPSIYKLKATYTNEYNMYECDICLLLQFFSIFYQIEVCLPDPCSFQYFWSWSSEIVKNSTYASSSSQYSSSDMMLPIKYWKMLDHCKVFDKMSVAKYLKSICDVNLLFITYFCIKME